MPIRISMSGMDRSQLRDRIVEVMKREDATLVDVTKAHGIASGLRRGRLVVEGDVGDYFGILNSGADLTVKGSAGRFPADNMTAGIVRVLGDAGDGVGDYSYGGTAFVQGSAGDFVGTMNKGGSIVIGGNVGHDAGTYMTAGEIVILGSAGPSLGNYLINGAIYILGEDEGLGENAKLEKMGNADFEKLTNLMALVGAKADPRAFRKIVPLSSKPFYKEKAKKEVRA